MFWIIQKFDFVYVQIAQQSGNALQINMEGEEPKNCMDGDPEFLF